MAKLAQLKKRFSSNESGAVQILLLDDHQVRGVGLVQCRLAPMQDSAADTLAGVQYLLMRPEFGTLASASKSASERQGWLLCLGGARGKGPRPRARERRSPSNRAGAAGDRWTLIHGVSRARLCGRGRMPTKLVRFNSDIIIRVIFVPHVCAHTKAPRYRSGEGDL